MIVISGCPRSGTSLMMLLHKEALGEGRIIGSQWMGIDPKYKDGHIKECVEYAKDKQNPTWKKEQEQSKAMNPNGFWECPWTVRGVQWVQNPPEKDKVCKIVSQGLANSNPQYIDKVVMMVRHPWSVVNSHKNLKINFPFASNTTNKDIGNTNPQMYINVTYSVCKWILANDPKILLVNYEDLIYDPDKTVDRVKSFVGEGDWDKAKSHINKKLQRNSPENPENADESWDLALDIHNKFKDGDWQGVVDVYDDHQKREDEKKTAADTRVNFFCPRWGGNVGNAFCKNCKKNDPKIIDNLKSAAERRYINWKNEPCLWDCGMNPIYYDKEGKPSNVYVPLTFDKSIQNNHWDDFNRVRFEGNNDGTGHLIRIEELDISKSNIKWGPEGNVLNNLEYKLNQTLGNPDIWQYNIVGAAFELAEDKTVTNLDVIISMEKANDNWKFLIEAIGAYGVYHVLFKANIKSDQTEAKNDMDFGGRVLINYQK